MQIQQAQPAQSQGVQVERLAQRLLRSGAPLPGVSHQHARGSQEVTAALGPPWTGLGL